MNTLVLTLALIFLPGIIWARLDARYASQTKPSQFELLINVFVFGLVAYLATYILYQLPGVAQVATFDLTALTLNDAQVADTLSISAVDDILAATTMALILAPIWLTVQRRKWIPKLLQYIGATKRYGDEDVWDYLLSSDNRTMRYVHVRDGQTGLTFAGYIEVYSETPTLRELVLVEVEGYDTATSVEVIENLPRMYLAREPKVMTLEFPVRDADIQGTDEAPPEHGEELT